MSEFGGTGVVVGTPIALRVSKIRVAVIGV
jgi:hypothetical protein